MKNNPQTTPTSDPLKPAPVARERRRRLSAVKGRDGVCFRDLHQSGRISEKRWLAKVWDGRLRLYRTKVHRTIEEAEAWAGEERSKMTLGLSSAGRLPLESLIEPYGLELIRRGRTTKHMEEVQKFIQEAKRERRRGG